MLVYRNVRRPRPASGLQRSFRREVERLSGHNPSHDEIRDLLVAFDEFESAVADALNPDGDGETSLEVLFRESALELGKIFIASWDRRPGDVRKGLARLLLKILDMESRTMPEFLLSAEAEGYAWYGLFPETYLVAARRFREEIRPEKVLCLGIRQIGASLSAVVGAALAEKGCEVRLHTVRPRGDPFDRRFIPSPEFAQKILTRMEGAHLLIIDEGPGLSGSSFCSVAEALSSRGVPDERIVFFPSWVPDGSRFVSPAARERWPRHRKFTSRFEDTDLIPSLARDLFLPEVLDLSAGAWRPLFFRHSSDFPAVHPQHEKRKYLFQKNKGFSSSRGLQGGAIRHQTSVLGKFAGFGHRGRAALERARVLEQAGFGTPVLGMRGGFLLTRFSAGRPLKPPDLPRDLLDFTARYLAFIAGTFPAADGGLPSDLPEMIRVNTSEGLGEKWADRLSGVRDGVRSPPIDLDGRMIPHEWLATPTGYLKMDGADHQDDHFYPGPSDIAWDLAGVMVEFHLDRPRSEYLLHRYAEESGDRDIGRRLPFFRLAYLAFRLGYASLAAKSLHGSEDGRQFHRLASRYGGLLQKELS